MWIQMKLLIKRTFRAGPDFITRPHSHLSKWWMWRFNPEDLHEITPWFYLFKTLFCALALDLPLKHIRIQHVSLQHHFYKPHVQQLSFLGGKQIHNSSVSTTVQLQRHLQTSAGPQGPLSCFVNLQPCMPTSATKHWFSSKLALHSHLRDTWLREKFIKVAV